MRECPNCSQQIQDEAVYCRHCHTELEPPLWLTSMRRCPYCAEWIENDLERCRYCDRSLFAAGSQHAAPFVKSGSAPEDELRQHLLDDDSDEAAAIAAAAEEFAAAEPSGPLAGFDVDAADEHQERDELTAEPEPSFYEEPQSDLRRSLYDEPEVAEEPSVYFGTGDPGAEYGETPVDSSIWMAGASVEEREEPRPLAEETDGLGRSIAGTEGVSDLREEASGPPGRIRRSVGSLARVVILVAALGAATWGLFRLSQGPVGAAISAALATDVPTETPIPEPTRTLRPAPTLPPVTVEGAMVATEVGTPSPGSECVSWDSIAMDDEGTEVCVYGVIKRWFTGADIPFVAIFSEDSGTFVIIDRTTTHPVGPGDCILARGTIEIMQATRPDIDAQGALEACPEGLVEG